MILAGYQIGACKLANIEPQDDMQDLASQLGIRIGYCQLSNDEELRSAVISEAEKHEIELQRNQVEVQHIGSGESSTICECLIPPSFVRRIPRTCPALAFRNSNQNEVSPGILPFEKPQNLRHPALNECEI